MKEKTKYWDAALQKQLIERLRQLRCEHGYTQEELIESTHLDISRYETGDSTPTLRSVARLCELYGITIAEFFSTIDYPSAER